MQKSLQTRENSLGADQNDSESSVHMKMEVYSMTSETRKVKFIASLNKKRYMIPGTNPESQQELGSIDIMPSVKFPLTAYKAGIKRVNDYREFTVDFSVRKKLDIYNSTILASGPKDRGPTKHHSIVRNYQYLSIPGTTTPQASKVKRKPTRSGSVRTIPRLIPNTLSKIKINMEGNPDEAHEPLSSDDSRHDHSPANKNKSFRMSFLDESSRGEWMSVNSISVFRKDPASRTNCSNSSSRFEALRRIGASGPIVKIQNPRIKKFCSPSNVFIRARPDMNLKMSELFGKTPSDSKKSLDDLCREMHGHLVKAIYDRDISQIQAIYEKIANVGNKCSEDQTGPFREMVVKPAKKNKLFGKITVMKDNFGFTPIALASALYIKENVEEDDIVKFLAEHGGAISLKNSIGNEPFHNAVLNVDLF